ncbi:hypothetical protein GCM10028864_53790 [Microlunatus parietis]
MPELDTEPFASSVLGSDWTPIRSSFRAAMPVAVPVHPVASVAAAPADIPIPSRARRLSGDSLMINSYRR